MVAGADLLLLLAKDDVFVEHLLRSELRASLKSAQVNFRFLDALVQILPLK